MKQGLAALLTRRTEQARHDAQAAVDSWQKAIDAVAQAGRMTGFEINLPTTLTTEVELSVRTNRSMDYIASLNLMHKAEELRQQTFAEGTRLIEQELKASADALVLAQRDIEHAGTQHTSHLRQIEAQKNADENSAYNLKNNVKLPDGSNTCTLFGAGCGISVVCIIVSAAQPNFIIIIVGCNSWWIVPLISSLYNGFTSKSVKAEAFKKSSALLQKAQANFHAQTTKAQSEFNQLKLVLEHTVQEEQIRKQSAETALQWLKAQA